jgi:hypothetical protein
MVERARNIRSRCIERIEAFELDKRRKFSQDAHRVAKEKVIVAELTPGGIEKLHAFRNFKAVDLNWLERVLDSLGEVDAYWGTLMMVYVLLV